MEPTNYHKILEELLKVPDISKYISEYQTYISDSEEYVPTMYVSNPIYWKLKSLIDHIEQEFNSKKISKFVYKRPDFREDWLSKESMIATLEKCVNLAKFDEAYKLPAYEASLCNQWVKATGFVYKK